MISTFNRTIRKVFLIAPVLLISCSGMEQSEREKVRRLNCKGELIYRNKGDHYYKIETPVHITRESYPWESEANLPRITIDFFRCKGSVFNPPIIDMSDPSNPQTCNDCDGRSRHGLPLIHGKEGVYPILIDLLNYIQRKTGKRVIITCGHRCPVHNTYSDPSKENRLSKHQIGAEVDFYVQGMEERPQEIIGLVMHYYEEMAIYKKGKEYTQFKRFEQTDLANQPWYNKEIFIKVFQAQEGRDHDNRHPHPYLSIQVRYDKDKKEPVNYQWGKANQGYLRS